MSTNSCNDFVSLEVVLFETHAWYKPPFKISHFGSLKNLCAKILIFFTAVRIVTQIHMCYLKNGRNARRINYRKVVLHS